MQTAAALSCEVDQQRVIGSGAPGRYRAYVATSYDERCAAYRLRFRVFNLELHEGLESAFVTGEDRDDFDAVCDHIIIEDAFTGNVVGTYRLQTGTSAARNLGYYSAREFDFTPYEPLRSQIVEVGRACIHPEHRKYEVLMLLWKAIARYACDHGGRYLIGCCSLNSQDHAAGSAVYRTLASALAPEGLRTSPLAGYRFQLSDCRQEVRPPKLLRAYLSLGANICGEPAIDQDFKTIDFLTLMDLNNLAPSVRARLGV